MAEFRPVEWARASWRRSPWIVISVGAHVGLGALLAIAIVGEHERVEPPPVLTLARVVNSAPPPAEQPVEPPLRQLFMPPPGEVQLIPEDVEAYVISAEQPDSYSQEVGNPEASPDSLGDPLPSSTSIGTGKVGQRGAGPSTEFHRGQLGRPVGTGTPGAPLTAEGSKMERAVLEGLRWLARHQNPDGSWSAATLRECCLPGASCAPEGEGYSHNIDVGETGLALLAFLGAGFGHDAKAFTGDTVLPRKHVMGAVVKNGLKWLVAQQNEQGSFSPGRAYMYNEALATLALCEAQWIAPARSWREPAQRAVDFLVRAQALSPQRTRVEAQQGAPRTGEQPLADGWGWRYAARADIEERRERGELSESEYALAVHEADTSVTTWCVMALKSAQLAGLQVPPAALEGALEYTRWVTGPDGLVGYLDPAGAGQKVAGPGDQFQYHVGTLSALGMCTRAFVAHDASDPFLELASKQLARDLPRVDAEHLAVDYYYWYYGSLALNQYDGPDSPRKGGKYWKAWSPAMQAAILALQDAREQNCSKGGWLVPDRWCHAGGPIYATATNVLTLEVNYRYPNAFGKGKGASKAAKTAAEELGEDK